MATGDGFMVIDDGAGITLADVFALFLVFLVTFLGFSSCFGSGMSCSVNVIVIRFSVFAKQSLLTSCLPLLLLVRLFWSTALWKFLIESFYLLSFWVFSRTVAGSLEQMLL